MDKYSKLIKLGISLITECNSLNPSEGAVGRICGTTWKACRASNKEHKPVHDITDDNPSLHLKAAYIAVHSFADKVRTETGIDPIRFTGSEEEQPQGIQILRAQANALANLYRMQIAIELSHQETTKTAC